MNDPRAEMAGLQINALKAQLNSEYLSPFAEQQTVPVVLQASCWLVS